MSEVATVNDQPISAATMESVLGTGDLSSLTTQQRVEYYAQVCKTIGVNPLTRPFRFMQFQGNTVLYATRDLTDQLRHLRKINLTITDKQVDGELYIVTAQASTPDGRRDEDMGAVTLGQLKGDARANAIMKAITKAKRRVTLSICGLGLLDESELETLPGAMTFDADAVAAPEPPRPEPVRAAGGRSAATSATPRPAVRRAPEPPPAEVIPELEVADPATWMTNLRALLAACQTQDEVTTLGGYRTVGEAIAKAPPKIRRDITDLLAEHFGRFEPGDDGSAANEVPEVEILGAEKLGAGD